MPRAPAVTPRNPGLFVNGAGERAAKASERVGKLVSALETGNKTPDEIGKLALKLARNHDVWDLFPSPEARTVGEDHNTVVPRRDLVERELEEPGNGGQSSIVSKIFRDGELQELDVSTRSAGALWYADGAPNGTIRSLVVHSPSGASVSAHADGETIFIRAPNRPRES